MEKGKMHFTKKTAIAIALLTVTVLAIGTLFVACDNNTNDGATAIVDTDKTYQTMEGFGASSAWTYQALGAIEDEEIKEQAMEMSKSRQWRCFTATADSSSIHSDTI